jgi:uncharacterized protein (TIGR02466 family)
MKFKKNSIFSPFFYQIYIDQDYKKIKDKLIEKIIHQSIDEGVTDYCWNIHTSYGDSHNKNELNEMSIIYQKYIDTFSKTYIKGKNNLKIYNIWYNVYNKGDSGPIHTHIDKGVLFSCVHYLKFNPEIHNSITFLNPRRASNKFLAKQNIEFKNLDFYKDEFTPNLKEDDLIIFPANLAHKVEPSTTDEPRITIAFNVGLND